MRIDRVADELSLSATPVREALHILRAEGLVQLDANKGFRVASMSQRDVSDVFQLLSFVSGELAARAAEKISDRQVDDLDELQRAIAEASGRQDWEEVESLNNRFHGLINNVADSPKLFNFRSLMLYYLPQRFYASVPGWPEASVSDHNSIIAAMRTHSPQAAREAMANHVTHAGTLIAANLDARDISQRSATAS